MFGPQTPPPPRSTCEAGITAATVTALALVEIIFEVSEKQNKMRRNYGETETSLRSPLDEASAIMRGIQTFKHQNEVQYKGIYEVDHEVLDKEGACGYP